MGEYSGYAQLTVTVVISVLIVVLLIVGGIGILIGLAL